MKNIIFAILAIIFLNSCSDMDKLILKKGDYQVNIKKPGGENTAKPKIEFYIDKRVVDSLKIAEEQIVKMCKEAVELADVNVKFKRTYEYPNNAMLYYIGNDKLNVSIDGTCQNGFGVRDDIRTYIPFSLKNFEPMKDSIISY